MANGGTPFQRALQTSTPGFDSLLKTIQQETSRLERNRQLIQQRKMKKDMLEFKTDLEVESFKKTTGAEKQKDRDLKRELAKVEQVLNQQEQAQELQSEQSEILRDAKAERREQMRKEWRNTYRDGQQDVFDQGFEIPQLENVEVRGQDPENLTTVYQLSDGTTMTPTEYNNNYGWSLEALDYIEQYKNNLSKDKFKGGTIEKEIEGTVTDAAGNAVNREDLLGQPTGDGEEMTRTVSKTYLGRDQAAQKIQQMRKGNLDVLREFQQGKLDFNTLQPGEGDIIRTVNSDYEQLRTTIQETEADAFPSTFLGLGVPGLDIGSDSPLQNHNIGRIETELSDEYNEDDEPRQRFTRLKNNYAKLTDSKRDLDNLYFNPNYDRNTPATDLFLTEQEFKEQRAQQTPGLESDIGNANDVLRKQQSANFYQQVITNPTTDR